ncbi:hypothetical protein MMC25_007554 [Agyrium rufum]|nr:hypothetical protein [Agyrium rufum]
MATAKVQRRSIELQSGISPSTRTQHGTNVPRPIPSTGSASGPHSRSQPTSILGGHVASASNPPQQPHGTDPNSPRSSGTSTLINAITTSTPPQHSMPPTRPMVRTSSTLRPLLRQSTIAAVAAASANNTPSLSPSPAATGATSPSSSGNSASTLSSRSDSIHYKRTKRMVSKIISLATIIVTLLGVFVYSLRSYYLAKWTAAKDFLEYCQDIQIEQRDPQCRSVVGKHLAPPPWSSVKYLVDGLKRRLAMPTPIPTSNETTTDNLRPQQSTWLTYALSTTTLTQIILGVLTSAVCIGFLCYCWQMLHLKKAPRQRQQDSDPRICHVRTEVPSHWASDPNRRIYLDEPLSTSTDAHHDDNNTNFDGDAASLRRRGVKLKSTLSGMDTTTSSVSDQETCEHVWRTTSSSHEICNKCRMEIFTGPINDVRFCESQDGWDTLKETLSHPEEEAKEAAHRWARRIKMIINREVEIGQDGNGDGSCAHVRAGVEGDGKRVDLELRDSRLGALGLLR